VANRLITDVILPYLANLTEQLNQFALRAEHNPIITDKHNMYFTHHDSDHEAFIKFNGTNFNYFLQSAHSKTNPSILRVSFILKYVGDVGFLCACKTVILVCAIIEELTKMCKKLDLFKYHLTANLYSCK
jgi:hypothetical protein